MSDQWKIGVCYRWTESQDSTAVEFHNPDKSWSFTARQWTKQAGEPPMQWILANGWEPFAADEHTVFFKSKIVQEEDSSQVLAERV